MEETTTRDGSYLVLLAGFDNFISDRVNRLNNSVIYLCKALEQTEQGNIVLNTPNTAAHKSAGLGGHLHKIDLALLIMVLIMPSGSRRPIHYAASPSVSAHNLEARHFLLLVKKQ